MGSIEQFTLFSSIPKRCGNSRRLLLGKRPVSRYCSEMTIRDIPLQCEIGDGVRASSVLLLDEFNFDSCLVYFQPEVRDAVLKSLREKVGIRHPVPSPWVFSLCRSNDGGPRKALLWRRES